MVVKDDIFFDDQDIENLFDDEDGVESNVNLTDEDLNKKYSESQIRIVRTALDFTLHTLVTSMKDDTYINISPAYQRRARWDKKKKSLLIESFLMNIPIPSLFLFEKDYNQYEVMDGRQRLEAVTEFLENKYALTGLEFWPELQGKRFEDLPSNIQRGLLRRTINAVVLLAETQSSSDVEDIRLILFRRLNTGGVKLNPQELRNALYPGVFNDMLHRISRSENFCDVWKIPSDIYCKKNGDNELGRNSIYKSMMDCELVLRFFAIRDVFSGKLSGSLRAILDKAMSQYSSSSAAEVSLLSDQYESTLKRVINSLGKEFNKLPNQLMSRPIYDAIMVAAYFSPDIDMDSVADSIKERINNALADDAMYEVLVGRGNTVDAIKDRVSLAITLISGD